MADRGSFHLGRAIDPKTCEPGADEVVVGSSAASRRWRTAAGDVDALSIRLEATDVRVVETRLVWVPAD